jgi:hypothetical protein
MACAALSRSCATGSGCRVQGLGQGGAGCVAGVASVVLGVGGGLTSGMPVPPTHHPQHVTRNTPPATLTLPLHSAPWLE